MSDDRARRAKALRNSPRAADREESERIFRELRDGAHSGTTPLVLDDFPQSVMIDAPQRENPALDEMASGWLSLRSPMHPNPVDYRFVQWFAEAQRQPAVFEQFAPRMLASINDWLVEYARLSDAVGTDEDPSLRHFDEWMLLALSYPAVAAKLDAIHARWSELRSGHLVLLRTRELEKALERGNLTAARNELNDIAMSGEVPQSKLDELRLAIEDLEGRQAEIDAWCEDLAGEPASWREVVRMYDMWAKGRRLAETPGRVQRVAGVLERLQTDSAAFIARRAGSWTSLDDLRRDLESLREASRGHDSMLDETWLEPVSASLVRLLDDAVKAAADVAALRRLASRAAQSAASLPARGGPHVQDALRRIADVAAAWETIEADELPPDLPSGILPARYVQHLERARLLADRIALAERTLFAGHAAAARVAACGEAMAVLQEVLTEAPRHAGARALLEQAAARLETARIDEWIERWDIGELRTALASQPIHDPLYASLTAALPVLNELAALRLRRSAATDVHALAAWWSAWRAREVQLPAQKPEALRTRLDDVRRDAAAAMRVAVQDHLARTTTLDQDRAAEAAVAGVAAEMLIREDLVALSQRSAIHAAVDEARAAGTTPLAVLVRDHWGTIERYLPWSGAILGETFERAWDEGDDAALDALRDVAVRGKHGRGESERFRHWLDWVDLERALFASATPDALRRMQTFLQREASSAPFIARRLAGLIARWRADGDDAALVWAYRALADLEPPLFPGADPLIALTRRSAAEGEEIVRVCREAPGVDDAFVRERWQELERIEGVWARLDQLLVDVPVAQGVDPWPAPPPELQRARVLLGALRGVLESVARWERSDLRTMGADCDAVRRTLLRELASYPAAEALDRVVRRVEPVTRLYALQDYLRNACARCTSDAPQDRERLDVFSDAARYLDAIIATLDASLPEGAHTVRVVIEEYWREIPSLAGDVLPPHPTTGLAGLRRRFDELQENDRQFADAIAILWREQPNVGSSGELDPDAHREYLARYPDVPPASVRARRRFDDFAARAAQRAILRRSRALLPEWLQRYVDHISTGVSPW